MEQVAQSLDPGHPLAARVQKYLPQPIGETSQQEETAPSGEVPPMQNFSELQSRTIIAVIRDLRAEWRAEIETLRSRLISAERQLAINNYATSELGRRLSGRSG
jgi:hypothetical protein